MKLSILIPTYNRCEFLKRNLELLESTLRKLMINDHIEVLVGNNCSKDETEGYLSRYAGGLNLKYWTHGKNIGAVKNVLFLLRESTSEFVMYLGDDDYLNEEYINDVFSLLISDEVSVVIPSNVAVDEDENEIGYGRDVDLKRSVSSCGFSACLEYSWRGHQMSGLVFKRHGLYEECKSKGVENMYLFIYMVAYSCLRGNVCHLTEHPVKVTRPSQAEKGWSYGDDGLISEIFDNYRRLSGVSALERCRLELKILDDQYWRYMMYCKKGMVAFFQAIIAILKGRNTSFSTALILPFLIPVFLFKRVVLLSINGKLLSTLGRKVDI